MMKTEVLMSLWSTSPLLSVLSCECTHTHTRTPLDQTFPKELGWAVNPAAELTPLSLSDAVALVLWMYLLCLVAYFAARMSFWTDGYMVEC